MYHIIPFRSFLTKNWSGGTTTELFIFPEGATYQARDFLFRLSTATVEVEASDFTALPGISRKIMILEGQTTLTHAQHYSKLLRKFDTDAFEGDWQTSSLGKCTDFNLMTKGSASGALRSLSIEAEQTIPYQIREKCDFFFVYVYAGKLALTFNQNRALLQKGDLLVLEAPDFAKFELEALEELELVLCSVSQN
jgi:environmental stress-induced protein Ves